MNNRAAQVLAVVALVVVCALLAVATALALLNQTFLHETFVPGLTAFTYSAVGALIAWRQARNWVGWLLLGFGILVSLGLASNQSAVYGLVTNPGSLPTVEWLAGPTFWVWPPAVGLLFLFLPLVFPTGTLLSPRWRWVAAAEGVFLTIGTIILGMNPEPDETHPEIRNPLALDVPPEIGELLSNGLGLVLIVFIGASFTSLVLRYRRATVVERQQLKWVMYAVTLLVAAFVLGMLLVDLLGLTWFETVATFVLDAAFLFVPVAIGIAILRYRLFDIDVIIRRTVTYAVVVVLLAIVYFGSVVLLQQIFVRATGLGRNELVTVVSTLAIAVLFVPLRNRVQGFVEARFYRKKYDAQQVLSEFGETVRDETDLDKLTARLVEVVNDTMQPESVSVWLNTQGKAREQRV
jgi:hypothetical protein